MAIVSIQVIIGAGATQISANPVKARWIAFSNNAAAVMRIGDPSVAANRGISLAVAGGFTTPTYPEGAYYGDLSQWYAAGTATQVLDVVYDAV